MAQDDYYYEIQLTNKQLVFYFMAGATGLILSFLAGVMVGRGVDSVAGEVQAARTVQEDRIVAEETPKPVPPATEDLTYAQRLEGDKVDDTLERPRPGAASTKPVSPVAPFAKVSPAPKPSPRRPSPSPPPTRVAANTPAPARPRRRPRPRPAGPAARRRGRELHHPGRRLQGKGPRRRHRRPPEDQGLRAHVSGDADGPFSVRVGSYADRAAAERDQARLRDEEKLQPFIVKR